MKADPTSVAQHDSDWNAFMARLEAAEVEFARGRPDDFKSLWSHTDDVTLCGGLGGAVELGWENVAARLTWASSNYAEGRRGREEISRIVDGDFAYLVQKEVVEAHTAGDHSRFKTGPHSRPTPTSLAPSNRSTKEGSPSHSP